MLTTSPRRDERSKTMSRKARNATWKGPSPAAYPIHNGDLLEWWHGTDWQFVRYERAGRANTFLVLEDDTIETLDRATM